MILLPASAGKGDGVYCVDLAVPAKNVVASAPVNVGALGTSDFALAAARTIIPAIPQCPAPFIDATVVTVIEEQSNTGPSQFPTGFYAIFHL